MTVYFKFVFDALLREKRSFNTRAAALSAIFAESFNSPFFVGICPIFYIGSKHGIGIQDGRDQLTWYQ